MRPWRVLAAACAILLVGHAARAEAPLRIATGGVTGFYQQVASALCRLLEPDLRTRVATCDAQATAGSVENLRALRTGTADLAIVQGDLLEAAYVGAAPFAQLPPQRDLRVLWSPGVESLVVVVRSGSGIEKTADLVGKRVDMGPAESGTRATATRLLLAAGLDPASFVPVTAATSSLAAVDLCARRSDAFVFVAAHPNPLVQEALAACPTRLIGLSEQARERILQIYPGYRPTVVGRAQYPGLDGEISTVGVPIVVVVARAGLPEATAQRVTAAVLAGMAELNRLHLALVGLDEAGAAGACVGVPFHDGAVRAFADAELAVSHCD